MARGLSAPLSAAAAAAIVRPYLLVSLDYAAAPVYVSSLPRDIDWNGQTWIGIGRLGSISEIQEGGEVRSYGVSLRMSGIPLEYATSVMANDGQGRAGRIWLGFLDAGHVPVGDPFEIFQGRIDVSDIEVGATISVTVTLESRLVDWERPRIRRFTDQDQVRAFPGDRGFEFVQAVTDMELVWGRS